MYTLSVFFVSNGTSVFATSLTYFFLSFTDVILVATETILSCNPYIVLDNIKNTGKKPFTFFYTLSCADIHWPENFTSLLEGHKITFESIDGKEEFYVDDTPLDDFLKAYPSKQASMSSSETTFSMQL